jgi:hypothetical protein
MVTTFFDLPRELRDEVYSYLVSGIAPFRFSSDDNVTLLAKGPLEAPTSAYPSWLLLNKAIHREGIEYLQQIGTVELVIKEKTWYADDFYDARIFAPFRPLQIRELHIDLLSQEGTWKLAVLDPKLRRHPYQVRVSAVDYMTHVVNDIAGLGKLEVLRLTTTSMPAVLSPQNIHRAISRVLPQLRRFEYEIKHALLRRPVSWLRDPLQPRVISQIRIFNLHDMAGLVLQSKDDLAKARVEDQVPSRATWRFVWLRE